MPLTECYISYFTKTVEAYQKGIKKCINSGTLASNIPNHCQWTPTFFCQNMWKHAWIVLD